MKTLRETSKSAFLLPETMIAMTIFSAISLALVMGFVSLERNLAATTDFATNHTDSVRISDYLALDLRRALSVQTSQNNTVITIPAYYDANGAPQTPQLDGEGGIFYGTSDTSVQIHYFLSNGTIYRQQDALPAVAIAENVSDFIFNVTDLGKVATTRITFSPIFRSSGASQGVTDATAVYDTILLRNSRTDTSSSVY
jgi:type II secretory pathway component PulJ